MADTKTSKKPAPKKRQSATKKTAKTAPKKASTKTVKKSSKAVSKTVKTTNTKPAKGLESKNLTASVDSNVKKTLSSMPLDKIKSLHISNLLTSVILVVLTFIFVKPVVKELFYNYQAKDAFVQSNSVNLVYASQSWFKLDLRYFLVAILVLTMVSSFLLGIKIFKRYQRDIQSGVSGPRWVLYGLVNVALFEFISLTAGVQDIVTLKMIGLLTFLTAIFAWQTEKSVKAGRQGKLTFYSAIITSIFALVPMLISLVATSLVSGERFGWHVYVLVAVAVLNSWANLVTLKTSTQKSSKYQYSTFEQRYLRIDQISKLIVVIAIFAAFNK